VRPKSALVDRHGNAYEGRRLWGAPFRYLIDNPAVMPIMREILGDPEFGHGLPQVPPEKRGCIRLDHDNVHYKPPAAAGLTSADKGGSLHGHPDNWHVTCVYELKSVPAGQGGLGVIAGVRYILLPLPLLLLLLLLAAAAAAAAAAALPPLPPPG
jgi:hypothetical protein